MKTSVIEVRGMLSVLSVPAVEKRIGEVPGVKSVTVNFAAGSATVRYDETRLNVADIKSAVRQRGYASTGESLPTDPGEHQPARQRAFAPTPQAVPGAASTLDTALPKVSMVVPAPLAPPEDRQPDKAAVGAPAPLPQPAVAKAGRPDDPSVKDADDVATALGADLENGLTAQEASRRLSEYGPNELRSAPQRPAWRRVLAHFQDPLVYLLLAAIAIALVAWVIEGTKGWPVDAIVIAAVVLLNAVLGYVQEARAQDAWPRWHE